MQSGRLAYIMARKAQLDAEVQQESNYLSPDQARLTTLKRRKLKVKEEIERLSKAA